MAAKSNKTVRIFMNHVDEYHGHYISKFLSRCVPGASLEEGEEEEEDEEEGQAVEGGGDEEAGASGLHQKEGCFELVGSLRRPEVAKKPPFVKEIFETSDIDSLIEKFADCDVIIYDITRRRDQIQEATQVLAELNHNVDKLRRRIVFVLVSTLMTWAKTSPGEEEDADTPLTDEDYKRRRPHPNFKEHLAAEKTTVMYGKTHKSRLATYIVGSGLTYGCGESIFHSLFKAGWHNAATLPILGNGQNVLPMIHVNDLAGVIQNIVDSRPKVKYIVAVDDSQGQTLETVVKTIAAALTTGKVTNVAIEDAVGEQVDQDEAEQLSLSLQVDSVFVKENFRMNWACETGLVENVEQIVKEFKAERGLQPIKICVLGPPGSGKTVIAKKICEHYKLHHVAVKEVIDEAIASLQRSAARADDEEEDDDGRAAEDAETLEQVNESLAENNGRLPDELVIKFFREKLGSKPCQNQGFVLDGFPKTKEAAENLFGADEDEEEEDDSGSGLSRKLLPEFLFLLEADDAFLKRRVMNLPECEVAGTHNSESGLLRRLAEYRRRLDNDDSALEFFEANEMPARTLDVVEDSSPMHAKLAEAVNKVVGQPRNYGLSEQEIRDIQQQEEEARMAAEKVQQDELERREQAEQEQRRSRQQQWADTLSESLAEEQRNLDDRSQPLRQYLMAHVMPSLTKGLMECAREKPDDAVDFLAEFLFRNNPQID